MVAKKDSVRIVGRAKAPKPKAIKEISNDPTHSQLCKAICDYMRTKHPDKLFIHIANEGKRSLAQGKKLKDEGLLAGVYDYFLAYAKIRTYPDGAGSFYPGLWIEVKTKKDRLSKAQKEFRQRAIDAHYAVLEVNNLDDFIREVDSYCK